MKSASRVTIGPFIVAVALLSVTACNDNSTPATDTTMSAPVPEPAPLDDAPVTITPPDAGMPSVTPDGAASTMPPLATDPSTNTNKDPATGSAAQ